MSSNRKSFSKRAFAGGAYAAYRDGPKRGKSAKIEPIHKGEARKHLIDNAMDILNDWRSSPFEHEGAVRHGLRSALCHDGHSWGRADLEASVVLAECFRLMGATRPTWEAGQRHATASTENCIWCGVAIPEEMLTGGRKSRFCSSVCAKSAMVHGSFETTYAADRVGKIAYRLVKGERLDERLCKQCGISFKPYNPDTKEQQFCSIKCRSQSYRKFPDRGCNTCGKVFSPYRSDMIYCSYECHTNREAQYSRFCNWCGLHFMAKSKSAKFCCTNHAAYFSSMRNGKRKAQVLTPPVFDYMFKQAA